MDEQEQLKQELQWVQYRQKMLNFMEEKLLQMRLLSEQATVGNLSSKELEVLNGRLNNLAEQVRAIDSESRRAEDGKILE
jgi:hypothetical protein